jgi:uncharacterized protein (DUF427 family)
MALTKASGPFGEHAQGAFNFTREGPEHVLFWEDSPRRVRVQFGDETIADTRAAKLLHETGHLPVYYIPEQDVRKDLLEPTDHTTHCPFKGEASYWSLELDDERHENLVWSYEAPLPEVREIGGLLCFYNERVDLIVGDQDAKTP